MHHRQHEQRLSTLAVEMAHRRDTCSVLVQG